MRTMAILFALLVSTAVLAQDREWVRTFEDAQRARPRTIASVARLAPAGEPGTPLVVHGRVLQRDGKTPAPNVIVFAYHTDATGVYQHRNGPGWRLRGWAKTDAQGRFEFQTIRPASYPGTNNPAHIHFTIDAPNLQRRWTDELTFDRALAVTTRGKVQYVDFTIRISDEGRF